MQPLLILGSNEITVRPGESDHFNVEPGQNVTFVFYVSNNADTTYNLLGTVILPDNWKLITKEFPFDLQKNQRDIRLVSVYVPKNTETGVYKVLYRVNSRDYPEISDQYSVSVRVKSVRILDIQSLYAPDYVIAGSSYTLKYLITNKSNVDAGINIFVRIREKYPVITEPSSIFLKRGESGTVSVKIKTDSTIQASFTQRVFFTAGFEYSPDVKTTVSQNVQVVPQGTRKSTGYHLFPVKAGFSNGMQRNRQDRSGSQLFIQGEGIIKDGTDQYLKFRLKGPDSYKKTVFFEHDEYFVDYSTNKFMVHLGDKGFRLTPLLENFRYGRGFEGMIKKEKYIFGGYVFKTRWLRPGEVQKAVYATYKSNNNSSIGINFLNKEGRPRHGSIFSIHSRFDRIKNSNIEAEIAVSSGKKAYKVNFSGRQPSVFYTFNLIYADKGFPGYYTDTRFFTTAFVYDLSNSVQISANYRQEHQNFEIDTTSYSAPFSKYGKVGIAYRSNENIKLFGDFVYRSRKDRMQTPLFNYDEWSSKVGGRYNYGSLSISGSVESGKTTNKLVDSCSVMYRFMSSLYFHPGDNFSARAFMYINLNNRYSSEREKRVTCGVDLRYRSSNKTSFYFSYQNNYSREEYYRNRDLFETSLEHTLKNGHIFSAKARYTLVRNTLNMRETALLFSYVIPYSVPVGRKQNLGSLKGRVYNKENGEPLKNVIFKMGKYLTISDKNGHFSFPALLPGNYMLNLDRSSLGLDAIPLQRMPMKVKIHGGQEVSLIVGITKSAKIIGKVVLFSSVPDSVRIKAENKRNVPDETMLETGLNKKLYPTRGLSGVIIEIKNSTEIKRWFTDKNGEFSFDDLRPGTWELKVIDTNIPKNFIVEQKVYTFDLTPGGTKTVTVRVVPKKRKIKIIQQGGTISEKNK